MNDSELVRELAYLLSLVGEAPRGRREPEPPHNHRCHNCTHIFTHGEECAGREDAHMCPVCGSGPWWARTTEPGG